MNPAVIWEAPANGRFMETAGIEPALCSRRERSLNVIVCREIGAAPRERPAPVTEGVASMPDQPTPERISLKDALHELNVDDAPRDGRCFYCRRFATRLEYDHFPIPFRFGGTVVVPACLTCHDLKDRRDILDWPGEVLVEAFEGLTPLAALLVGRCLAAGLDAMPDLERREPRGSQPLQPQEA